MPTEVLLLVNQAAGTLTRADPEQPHLSVLDWAATRGDGVFETLSVGFGHPQAFEHHLRRFASSAAALELPVPDEQLWRRGILTAIEALDPVEEAWVKIVLTRGIEGGDGTPTGWAYATHSADYTRERTEGVRVVLLDRGYRHDVARTSPWLLQGAKTLSYAVNRAAFREATRRDADDVLFVSSDGFLLEGPTSTLVYRRGTQLFSPGVGLGILDGTTQANVFRYAQQLGLGTAFEQGTPDTLRAADAAWLVSSVRLAAPIRAIDGVEFPVDAGFTVQLNDWLRTLTQ